MNAETQRILEVFLALCGPFILAFMIVAILSPRFEALSKRNGWTVQPHPEDHRDYLFKGQQANIQWEMEYYVYDHYRKLPVNHIPSIKVIVWSTGSVRLPQNTLLIYPRRDKLKHFVHPRLTLVNDTDLVTNREREKFEEFLSDLPEKTNGINEFRESFVLRADFEVLPHALINSLQFELSSWSKTGLAGPIILMNSRGIMIWWIPIGMRNEWLEKTVGLGTSLARSL